MVLVHSIRRSLSLGLKVVDNLASKKLEVGLELEFSAPSFDSIAVS